MGRTKGVRLSQEQIRRARKTGRLGGLTRAANMTAKQRRESAVKASRAAAEARWRKASSR